MAEQPGLPTIDLNEYGGRKPDGERQSMNRRLFMQLLVARVDKPTAAADRARAELTERKVPAVIYADMMHPRGLGVLTWSEDPAHFVRNVRPLFEDGALAGAEIVPEYGMVGRAYSNGYEPDLEHVLLRRSVDNVLNVAYPWHIWYPLRRTGAFAKLDEKEQGSILREHAVIGHAYGQSGHAHDVRLACHGLDAEDNEFLIGLVGKELHPLSHLVQTMRKTRQTSEFIAKMGPFFVGHVAHRIA
ncbi:MAG: chlorite dismutase family protein [Myxococcales bacterium]|nr:chlorite dismutase family protein [Myxococcales bacterium]